MAFHENPETLREQAITLGRLGHFAQACDLLSQAHKIAPHNIDIATLYGAALYNAGDLPRSIHILQKLLAQTQGSHQAHLLLARSLLKAGEQDQALEALSGARKAKPDDNQAYQLACQIIITKRDWPHLINIAEEWAKFCPNAPEAWTYLAQGHFENMSFKQALHAYEKRLGLGPHDTSLFINIGRVALAAQDYGKAEHYLNLAQSKAPNDPSILYALSRLNHLLGHLAQSEDLCRQSLALQKDFAPAYVQLGALLEGRLEKNLCDAIRLLLKGDTLSLDYRSMLHFTLADALDRAKEHQAALQHYHQGNELNAQIAALEGIGYDPALPYQDLALMRAIFNEAPAESALPPIPARPIFIVAMPRSGTTLLESILAAHSQVDAAGELPLMPAIQRELIAHARTNGPEAARQFLKDQRAKWRLDYMQSYELRQNASVLVDKQPINFQSLGLIRSLFPEAIILHIRRAPLDSCFSIYRHNFSKNWPCAHKLEDIGHYFGYYTRLCTFWAQTKWVQAHDIAYGDLVSHPEQMTRHILDICGLAFEADCLAPHEITRPVATFSAVQIRQPITPRYQGRYSPYLKAMAPLIDALEAENIDPQTGMLKEA